jgi:hypothetical protein
MSDHPSGNALYIVCTPCFHAQRPEHGVRIASRTLVGYYDADAPQKTVNGWFQKHAKCAGRGIPDHFALAHAKPMNHDQDRLKQTPDLKLVEPEAV